MQKETGNTLYICIMYYIRLLSLNYKCNRTVYPLLVQVDKPNFSMGDLVRVNADERNLDELHAHTEHHRFYVSEVRSKCCKFTKVKFLTSGV